LSFLMFRDEADVREYFRANDHPSCYLFVCDFSLNRAGRATYLGARAVQAVKKEFPEVFCILTSWGTEELGREAVANPPGADMYIAKERFLTDKERIKAEFRRAVKMDLTASVDVTEALSSARASNGEVSQITRRELEALIRQIIFRDLTDDGDLEVSSVELRPPAEGGRSGSMVYVGTVTVGSEAKALPAVIKISLREKAITERRNYDRFVKPHLSHLFRADVLGQGETERYGAVAFSFAAGGVRGDPKPVTDYVRKGNFAALAEHIIPNIFTLSSRGWYAPEMVRDERGLAKYYHNKFFRFADAPQKSNEAFDRTMEEYFFGKVERSMNTVGIGSEIYPWRSRIPRSAPSTYQSCICHGDFNSSNIIVAEREKSHRGGGSEPVPDRFVFIDFQDTGRGHVFSDFVAFESSLRLDYGRGRTHIYESQSEQRPENKQLNRDQFLQWEGRLAQLGRGAGGRLRDAPELFRLIEQVRFMAQQNFRIENWNAYLYATAIHHFRLLRMKDKDEHQRARLVAAVISSLKQLKGSPGS